MYPIYFARPTLGWPSPFFARPGSTRSTAADRWRAIVERNRSCARVQGDQAERLEPPRKSVSKIKLTTLNRYAYTLSSSSKHLKKTACNDSPGYDLRFHERFRLKDALGRAMYDREETRLLASCAEDASFSERSDFYGGLVIKARPFVASGSPSFRLYRYFSTAKSGGNPGTTVFTSGSPSFVFQNDTMQVVWQYHVEEPVSAAGVLPDHGAVRGSRPLYLVQRDAQPRRNSRNQETEPPLKIWDILNKQVSRTARLRHFLAPKFAPPSVNCKKVGSHSRDRCN